MSNLVNFEQFGFDKRWVTMDGNVKTMTDMSAIIVVGL